MKIEFERKRVKLLSISAFLLESNHVWMRADGNHYKSARNFRKAAKKAKRHGKKSTARRICEYKRYGFYKYQEQNNSSNNWSMIKSK